MYRRAGLGVGPVDHHSTADVDPRTTKMPDATTILRQAVDTVRAQIPKGELTLASVERLLKAAEAVCAETVPTAPPPSIKPSAQTSKRQEERKKWARIAKQNEKEARSSSISTE